MNRSFTCFLSFISTVLYFGICPLLHSDTFETFELLPIGATASQSGWSHWAGTGAIDGLTITTASQTALGVKQALTYKGSDIQISKPFATPLSIKASQLYYITRFIARSSGGQVQRILFGVLNRDNKSILLFGIGSTEPHQFRFALDKAVSERTYPAENVYELCFTLDRSQGKQSLTGSLATRNLSQAENTFTPIAGLQGVPLELDVRNQPSQWSAWLLRFQARQEIGSLLLTDAAPEELSTN